MTSVPFTQFLRPDGRRKLIFIARPDEVTTKAVACIDAGYGFEAEVLTNGLVSLTSMFDDETVAIEIGPNDEGVPARVDRLVEKTFEHLNQGENT